MTYPVMTKAFLQPSTTANMYCHPLDTPPTTP